MDLFAPAASFDQPLAMLDACHGKVRRFCRQLDALPQHLRQHGWDEGTRQAVQQLCRYFSQAAPLHHADEERDFFPLLQQYCPQAAADIALLQAQHRQLHTLWQRLHRHLAALSANSGREADTALIRAFTGLYAQHMAIEEPWFAHAITAIPIQKQAAIGKTMAARRQTK